MTNTTQTTERSNTPLTVEEKAVWVEMYNTKRKLPSLRVPCSVTGIGVVMFADNLHKRVIKFGGIENLLNNFVCRTVLNNRRDAIRVELEQIKADQKAVKIAEREAKIAAKNVDKTKTTVTEVVTEKPKMVAKKQVDNKIVSKKKAVKTEEVAA